MKPELPELKAFSKPAEPEKKLTELPVLVVFMGRTSSERRPRILERVEVPYALGPAPPVFFSNARRCHVKLMSVTVKMPGKPDRQWKSPQLPVMVPPNSRVELRDMWNITSLH